MARVVVVTDSIAGISPELARQYDIRVVPTAHIVYGGTTYIDGITINGPQAYELLKNNPDKFNTSAISPDFLLSVYRELGRQTSDIFFITVSVALSAVSRSAAVAADLFKQESPATNIRIFDSKSAASGQGLVVLEVARAAKEGKSLDNIARIARLTRDNTECFVLIDTLRYVYRTGRVPRLASMVGAMLGVKPIVHVSAEGDLRPAGIVRTRAAGLARLVELVKSKTSTRSLHFMIMHADALAGAKDLAAMLKKEFDCLSLVITEFSPVMGYGSGPGSISVGFHPDLSERE